MKAEKKEKMLLIIREIIVTQTNHWSMFGLAYGLSVMLSEILKCGRIPLLSWALMGAGLIFQYFIRKKVSNVPLSLLLHLISMALMAACALPQLPLCILYAAFAFFYSVLSVSRQLGSDNQEDVSFPVAVIALLVCVPFFVLTITDYPEVTSMYRNLLICLFTMFFVQHYLGRYARFVTLNEHSAGFFPKSDIMGMGLKHVIVYTGLSAGLFFTIANMDSLTRFGNFIKDKLGRWFKDLLKSLFGNDEPVPDTPKPLDYHDFDSLTTQIGELEGGNPEPSLFTRIIDWVGWILLMGLLLFLLYTLIKKILALFNLKLERPDVTVSEVVTDVRESCSKTSLKQSSGKKFGLFLTPEEKIRRSFKRTVSEKCYSICKSGDVKRLGYRSAKECALALKAERISEIYDRARYSNKQVTEKDAAEMKTACQNVL